jgi:hypothetical protein
VSKELLECRVAEDAETLGGVIRREPAHGEALGDQWQRQNGQRIARHRAELDSSCTDESGDIASHAAS